MTSTTWSWLITIVGGLLVAAATPKLIELVYGSNTPIAARPSSVPSPDQSMTSTAPAPVNAAQPLAEERAIADYIEWEYLRDLEKYADVVDYFDKGPVKREFVINDKAEFANRWPVRRYVLTPGSLIVRLEGGVSVVTFNYSYSVANGVKRTRGSGRTRVKLLKVDDGLVVTSVKEAIAPKP